MPDENLGQYIEKLNEMSYKIIVFVVPGTVKVGLQNIEIRFPFSGVVESVYCSMGTPGTTETAISIEKCSQDFIDGVANASGWTDVLADVLTIDVNKKSSNTSASVAISNAEVESNEHFRINVLSAGEGAKDLSVEVKIKIVN
ncbi:hypothetical protein D3C71_1261420 [compost metagenome]